jgi:predicted transcriptional regulator
MSNIGKIPEGNRSKLEIIAQILREICLPTGRTCIMSHCNMCFAQSVNYLKLMKSRSRQA